MLVTFPKNIACLARYFDLKLCLKLGHVTSFELHFFVLLYWDIYDGRLLLVIALVIAMC